MSFDRDDPKRPDAAPDEPATERHDPVPAPAEDELTTELPAAAADDATQEHAALEPEPDPLVPDDEPAAADLGLGPEPDPLVPDDAPAAAEPDGPAFDEPAAPAPLTGAGAPAAADPEALRDWPAGDTSETRIVADDVREQAPGPLPSPDFAVVWRGYDVHAVDAYVAAAEAAIADYEEKTLPTVAVQRALDRVGEQTASILREAEQAAEETARTSRAQADDRLQRAEREAQEVRAAADARVRDLDDDIERLWQERQRLIDATRDLAGRLRAAAEDAESRFPPAEAPPGAPSADASPPLADPPGDDEPPPPA